jgi:hypothetical protein
MKDKDPIEKHSEELLDDIAARIRSAPIPDYPGPPVLDQNVIRTPFPRIATIAAGCCLVVLCISAIAVMNWDRPTENSDPLGQVAESDTENDVEFRDLVGGTNPTVGPTQIVSFDPTPELDRMTDGLDQLSKRLDQLEAQVAISEVQSDVASLLVQYTPREYKAR